MPCRCESKSSTSVATRHTGLTMLQAMNQRRTQHILSYQHGSGAHRSQIERGMETRLCSLSIGENIGGRLSLDSERKSLDVTCIGFWGLSPYNGRV